MASVRPARRFDARRALTGPGLPNGLRRPGTFPALPLPYRVPSRSSRTAPPTRGPACRAMLPSLGFPTSRRMPDRRILITRGSRPRMAPRPGFGYPIRGFDVEPPHALRRRSVHRLHPSRPSPRSARAPSRASLPSWRCSRRIASLPRGACGRGRLQGFDLEASSFCHSGPQGVRRADAFLGFVPPEHSPLPS